MQRKVHAFDTYYESDTNTSDGEYMGSVKSKKDALIYAEMSIHKKTVTLQIDYSASPNIIPMKYLSGRDVVDTSKSQMLRMWNGTEVKPLESARLNIRNPKAQK